MRNEDAYVYEPPLLAIADGMGGARAGEVAAGIAAAALKERRRSVTDEASLERSIIEATVLEVPGVARVVDSIAIRGNTW